MPAAALVLCACYCLLPEGGPLAHSRAVRRSRRHRGTVHLLSPGEQILSTTHNNWYGLMDGTSMACPLVAGAAALLQSAALRWVGRAVPGEWRARRAGSAAGSARRARPQARNRLPLPPRSHPALLQPRRAADVR